MLDSTYHMAIRLFCCRIFGVKMSKFYFNDIFEVK